jgi:hypothetical protein
MKKVVWLSVLGVVGFLLVVFVGSILSFRGKAVNFEESIKAQYTQNQNNYDNMWKKFREMAQVTDKYADDLKVLFDNAMTGRYGQDGSKAVFQFIIEQNPTLSLETYSRLQSTIESGRDSFQSAQEQLIAKKEQYTKLLRSNSAIIPNAILRYPRIDLNMYGIVTSDQTDKVFEDKKADEVKLF